ncbi:MAG: TrkH family potassium uptake protein [Treponema sp.]|jgi:trk system potassium uptake protein TrkH|nr:TrkH family potassium uptake protein [Treponema sp.]
MKQGVIFRLLSLLLGIIGLTMIIPLIMAAFYGEMAMVRGFVMALSGPLIIALPVLISTRKSPFRLSPAGGLLLVFFVWVFTCLMGGLPFFISGYIPRFSDAVFESVSGFTTTGATILLDVEAMPRSLLFWRAMTHWLGGMGIVVLTVALLPLLGAGGFQLVKAEAPGPETEKLTPKITATAKILWLLYISLTGIQTLLLMAGGMDWFDAVIHAFSTLATGGFSSRNNSIAAYHSPWIDWVCIIFMALAGFNFSLIWGLLRGKYQDLMKDSEAKAYGGIILVSTGIVTLVLCTGGDSLEQSLRCAFFQVLSILTTTGFTLTDQNCWPPLAQGVLFFLMFVGGCSGSTAGGIKVIRHVVLFKQAGNEMKKLLYPKGICTIRLNKMVGRKDVVYGVAGFVFLYMALMFAATFLVSAANMDLFSALNVGALTLGNIGLGLGASSSASVLYGLPAYVKWGLSFIMIAGRLELWTALVFFSRDYWQR